MSEMSLYTWMLFVHVASAMVLIGVSVVMPAVRTATLKAATLAELRGLLDFSRRAHRWNPLAAFVLLGTGIYLGSIGWWTQPWFHVAVGAWVMNALLAGAVVERSARQLGAAAVAAGDGPIPRHIDALRLARAPRIAHGLMTANDAAILYLMFQKPGLPESLLWLVGANLAALGVLLVARRRVEAGEPALT